MKRRLRYLFRGFPSFTLFLFILFLSGCSSNEIGTAPVETFETDCSFCENQILLCENEIDLYEIKTELLEEKIENLEEKNQKLNETNTNLLADWNLMHFGSTEYITDLYQKLEFEPKFYMEENSIHITYPREIFRNPISCKTSSMLPTIGCNSILVFFKPEDESDVHVGDIIKFKAQPGNEYGEYGYSFLIHRVISIGEDAEGWYAKSKGDNNISPDAEKIRFKDILGVYLFDFVFEKGEV